MLLFYLLFVRVLLSSLITPWDCCCCVCFTHLLNTVNKTHKSLFGLCCLKSVIFCTTRAVCFSHLLTRRQPQAMESICHDFIHTNTQTRCKYLAFTAKAKPSFFASFLCVCVSVYACVFVCVWYVGSQVIIQVLSNLHKQRTKNLHSFVCVQSCSLSISLSFAPQTLSLPHFFLHENSVYEHICRTNFFERKQWIDVFV